MNGASFDSMITVIVAVIWLVPLGWTQDAFINFHCKGNTLWPNLYQMSWTCHSFMVELRYSPELLKVGAFLIIKVFHTVSLYLPSPRGHHQSCPPFPSPPGVLPPCPWPRTPGQSPKATNPCLSNTPQSWAAAPHSPALPRPTNPCPSLALASSILRGHAQNVLGWGCPSGPQAVTLPPCQPRDPLQFPALLVLGTAGPHGAMAQSTLSLTGKLLSARVLCTHIPQQSGFSAGFIWVIAGEQLALIKWNTEYLVNDLSPFFFFALWVRGKQTASQVCAEGPSSLSQHPDAEMTEINHSA